MVTETVQHYPQPCCDSTNMAERRYTSSPTPETVSSVADAMLKLSSSAHHIQHQQQHQHQTQQVKSGHHTYSMDQNMPDAYSRQNVPQQQQHQQRQQQHHQVHHQQAPVVQYPAPGIQPEYANHSPSTPPSPSSPRSRSDSFSRLSRKEREFVPEFKKDDQYWLKRQKNNEAAKRSREKRRMNDLALSDKLNQMAEEKKKIAKELEAIKRHFGLPLDKTFQPQNQDPPTNSSADQTPIISAATRPSVTHTTSSESYTRSSPTSAAPPLIPLQGSMMESMARRASIGPASNPPPLQPVTYAQEDHHTYGLNSQAQTQQQPRSPVVSNGYSHMSVPQSPSSGNSIQSSVYSPHQTRQYQSQQSPTEQQYVTNPHFPGPPRTPESSQSGTSSPQNLQIVLSPAQSDTSEYEPNGPLNLSKRRKIDLSDSSSQDSMEQRMALAHERKGIPHKLRYKNYSSDILESTQNNKEYQNGFRAADNISPQCGSGHFSGFRAADDISPQCESGQFSGPTNSQSVQNDFENDSNDSSFSSFPYSDNSNTTDARYLERRYRNNIAARKCRENRRALNDMRLVKSDILENENGKLKDELRTLSEEVHGLKRLIEQKNQAKISGEPFEPPPLDNGANLANLSHPLPESSG